MYDDFRMLAWSGAGRMALAPGAEPPNHGGGSQSHFTEAEGMRLLVI
jgi:hypothetical protein